MDDPMQQQEGHTDSNAAEESDLEAELQLVVKQLRQARGKPEEYISIIERVKQNPTLFDKLLWLNKERPAAQGGNGPPQQQHQGGLMGQQGYGVDQSDPTGDMKQNM